MDSMDRLKINSYIMVVAGRLVVQGHDVFRLPRGTEINVNKDVLNRMGGRYLTLLDVYNSGSDFRRVSLDHRHQVARDDPTESWQACY